MKMCANIGAYFSSVGQHSSSHVGQHFSSTCGANFPAVLLCVWSCKLYLVLPEEHLKATCKSGVGNVSLVSQ